MIRPRPGNTRSVRAELVEALSFFSFEGRRERTRLQAQPGRSGGWKLAAGAAIALSLSSCGLRPLYQGGGSGPVAQSLRSIQVGAIGGRAGWLVRTALIDRLGEAPANPQYRLEIELDDQITGFGIRTDDAVTRERRTLRARYRLVDAAAGTVLVDATAGSDAGIDVVSSDYATVAAEQTALERLSREVADQIVTRLALYASRTEGQPR